MNGKKVRVFLLMISLSIVCSLLSSCVNIGEKTYYKKEENYITVTDKITYISYDETEVYLRFEELGEQYNRNGFWISGKNFKIVTENGLKDKIELEKEVDITFAPAIMGNGYFIPIVALTVDDEVLLEFEEGKDNLVAEYWYMWY